jgi:hypothetical protein
MIDFIHEAKTYTSGVRRNKLWEGAFQIFASTVRRENNIGNTPEVLRYPDIS